MKTITVYLYTVLLALAGFAPTGFAATDYINVQFSNGGASQTGAAVIGSAGDYWNKTTGSSGTNLSLNTTGDTSSGASLSWSASGVGSTGTNNAFIAQNTAWKNLFSGQIYAASGSTMTANFSGLTANIPVRVYFYSENDQGGNGRKLQASLNGGAYAATTVGSDNTVYSFIKNQNYLVVDGTANASGQLNINLKGVSGARDGTGILMGIQLIASNDIPSLTLTTPNFENVGAGMATLLLQASADGTGYFTLLAGSNTACGTAAQVQAGLTSTGATAPYHGSLPLTANTQGKYTVRNLTQVTDYTVCFTADSPTLLPATPVSANLSTTAAYLNGPAWNAVGSAGFSAGQADYTSLAFAPDGTPYVAYRDWLDLGTNQKATVKKFNGTTWVTVGTAGFSAGQADYTSLAFAPDGTPYLAYTDDGNSGKATVMKFNGTAWDTVGAAGFSAGGVGYTSLAFAPDGTPYLAYQDYGNSGKATVKKFNGTAWDTVGTASFSAGEAAYTSLAFAPDGTPYLAYQDYGNSGKATVMQFATSQTATATALQSSLNPAKFGQSVTLTAAVSPSAATGSVTFKEGGSDLGTSSLSNGSATYVNSALSVGSHGITAVYAGDTSYSGSTSNTLTQIIQKADTSTGVVSSPNPSNVGDAVTFTATVTPSATGTVNFFDGASSLGSGTLNGSSQASVNTSALTVGGHSITGVYSGNAAYNTSISSALMQTVNSGGVAVTVTTNPAALGITVDGTDYSAPQSFNWVPGSSHSLAVTSPQAGTAGTRYPFANWSDGGLQSHSITTPTTPTTYTASFGTEYQLMLNAGVGGSIIPASGNWYTAGSTPSIISTASNSGYVFNVWSLDSGTGPVLNTASAATQVTMNGPNTVSAAFKAVSTTLTAAITGKTGTIGGVRFWDVTVTNTGSATATAAQLDGLTLSSSGACKPSTTTAFPLALGDINPGGSKTGQVWVDFTGCKSSIKFSVNIRYSADGGTSSGVTPLTGVSQ